MAHLAQRLRRPRVLAGGALAVLLLLLVVVALASRSSVASPTSPDTSAPAAPASAVKVLVDRAGMVQLTGADLDAARLGWNKIDPSRIQLSYRGQEQPLWVQGQGSSLTFRFYAQASHSRYSRQNVYWLEIGDKSAQPMEVISTTGSTPTPRAVDYYTATVHTEENHLYAPQVQEGDHWFWAQMPAPLTQTFTVSLSSLVPGPGHLRVEVWGSTDAPSSPDHHLRIAVNGQPVSDEKWDGAGRHTLEADVPGGVLRSGDNDMAIEAPGDTGVAADIVFIDWIEISYPRSFTAQADRLEFVDPGGPQQLVGFSGPIDIFDITQPDRVARLIGHSDPSLNPKSFEGQAGHRYIAVGTGGYQSAQLERPALEPDLRAAGNGADYIAVGPPDLLQALQPLLDFRGSHGLKAMAIPAEAVYDQFDNGLPEPEAIREFMKYAAQVWQPAPKYLLLVGDATYDTLGYISSPEANRLPTFFVQTGYGGETASDVAFVELTDDSLPDMAAGRVPARTPEQVRTWVAKTLAYEQSAPAGAWRQRVLAVADGQESSFKGEAQAFLEHFTAPYQTSLVNPPAGGADDSQQVLSDLNEGNLLVAYFGHGSITQWGKDNLFTTRDVAALQNGSQLPVVLNMTCLTGLFTHPKVESLAESLLWKPDGGAVAVLAPTSLTLASDQSFLSNALVDAYLSDPTQSLGQIVLSAWRAIPRNNAGAQDVLRTFLLFGDPALRLAQP